VPLRIPFKLLLPFDGSVDFRIRYCALFGQSMRNDDDFWTGSLACSWPVLEKVEHPIVDALIGRPQFIDTIPEIISDRPSQFVSKVFELIQVSLTLRLNLLGLPIEPRKEQDRCLVIVVLIENYLGPWHTVSSPMFSDLRTSVKWLFRRQRNKWPFCCWREVREPRG